MSETGDKKNILRDKSFAFAVRIAKVSNGINILSHFEFSKTILFNIPFRGLGRKIQLKTAPKSPKGDLKLQPYRLTIFRRIRHYLILIT